MHGHHRMPPPAGALPAAPHTSEVKAPDDAFWALHQGAAAHCAWLTLHAPPAADARVSCGKLATPLSWSVVRASQPMRWRYPLLRTHTAAGALQAVWAAGTTQCRHSNHAHSVCNRAVHAGMPGGYGMPAAGGSLGGQGYAGSHLPGGMYGSQQGGMPHAMMAQLAAAQGAASMHVRPCDGLVQLPCQHGPASLPGQNAVWLQLFL